MRKAHKKFSHPTMRRSSRVFLNDLNASKTAKLVTFLLLCHDVTQYFVDLFWQRKDTSSDLADIATVHRATERFGITTRLGQALAKQAKELLRAGRERNGRKPRIRRHTVTLYSHFVKIEAFNGAFDLAVKLIGSGAPRMVIPVNGTKHLNEKLDAGWKVGNSIRLGRVGDRLFIDFLLEKPRPKLKPDGKVVGFDSNYKNGFVLSDEQQVGAEAYELIRSFDKRRKHTHESVKSLVFAALKKIDLSVTRMLVVEDLKRVKSNTRGKFPRTLNRRLSHWLYASVTDWLQRRCEESGVRLERKDPWKTSQRCAICGKWDRRSRKGDRFKCVHCGHTDHADRNASKNLEFLGLAGAYGLRSLQNPKCRSFG
jgi:IS605 OrfB family transposase